MVSGIGFFVYINNAVSKVPFLVFVCVFFAWLCLFPLLLLLLFSRSRNTLTFSCNLSTERFRFNFLLKPRQFFLIWMCSIFIVCKCFSKRYILRSSEETTLEMNWQCFCLLVFLCFLAMILIILWWNTSFFLTMPFTFWFFKSLSVLERAESVVLASVWIFIICSRFLYFPVPFSIELSLNFVFFISLQTVLFLPMLFRLNAWSFVLFNLEN